MIITPASLKITQLLGATNERYVIPAYQRRYSWRDKQLQELLDDISLLEDTDTHLLGSIVCLTSPHTAGVNSLELVDGQQRLTTLSILLHCILESLRSEEDQSEVQDIERLLQARAQGNAPVRKIALDSIDGFEFDELVASRTLEHPANPSLAFAFSKYRNWAAGQSVDDLKRFLYKLQNQAIIIRLDVSDAKDAFKLFETINNRGLHLSPTDIIKNFILGNAARFGKPQLEIARTRWAELIRHLDGTKSDSFFRHFLSARLSTRITASYVIDNFKEMFMRGVVEAEQLPDRKHWYSDGDSTDEGEEENTENGDNEQIELPEIEFRISFQEFLDHLILSAKTYGQIVLAKTGNIKIDRHLRNLRLIKATQSYGFLTALRVDGCSDDDFVEVLKLTESFLLRRHICRERSNETEQLFARIDLDCSNPVDKVAEYYREMSPSDERFREAFAKADFIQALIDRARYCLEQFELDRQGTYLELLVGGADLVQVEHIIPQKIKTKRAIEQYGDWPTYLGTNSEGKHPQFVSRIGNLTLFAGTLNVKASNNPYQAKKVEYAKSAIKITNSLPKEFRDFRFAHAEKRSATLAGLAVKIWPIP